MPPEKSVRPKIEGLALCRSLHNPACHKDMWLRRREEQACIECKGVRARFERAAVAPTILKIDSAEVVSIQIGMAPPVNDKKPRVDPARGFLFGGYGVTVIE